MNRLPGYLLAFSMLISVEAAVPRRAAADAAIGGPAWTAAQSEQAEFLRSLAVRCEAAPEERQCLEYRRRQLLEQQCREAPEQSDCLDLRRKQAAQKQFLRQLCDAYPAVPRCQAPSGS